MSEHILSLSYGKDSLACLGAIEHLGWPLDRIVTADVWATETIRAEYPVVTEFKCYADEIIKKRYGIQVEHYHAKNVDRVIKDKVTYEDVFYHTMIEGNYQGSIKGFPMQIGPWCQKLKLNALKQISKGNNVIEYLGIAADEPKRIASHIKKPNIKLHLVEIGWQEDYCGLWCQYSELLNPTYTTSARDGCWFCHNQGVEQLRLLRKNHPDLWAVLLKWDKDSPVSFKPDGRRVCDYDNRFQLEDDGFVDPNEQWRWQYLNCLQLSLFR